MKLLLRRILDAVGCLVVVSAAPNGSGAPVVDGTVMRTDALIVQAMDWEDPCVTWYKIETSFEWAYSEDVARRGGLVRFCDDFHKERLVGGRASCPDGEARAYWCTIIRYPDDAGGWSDYIGGIVREASTPHPCDLFVYAGRVWDCRTLPYRAGDSRLADVAHQAEEAALVAAVDLAADRVAVGDLVDVAITVTNVSDAMAFVPIIVREPVVLAARSEVDGDVFRSRGPYADGMIEFGPGWSLGPGCTTQREMRVVIGEDERRASLALEPGEYAITVFDMSVFGLPTSCVPRRLVVEGSAPHASWRGAGPEHDE